jgi:hypothetical protein
MSNLFQPQRSSMVGEQYKIAISGKARAGKNTVASFLVKHLGLNDNNSKIVALADPMKHIAKIMFPDASTECLFGPSELRAKIIPGEFLDSDDKALTYRRFLLDLGAFGRKYNNDIWLNCLVKDAELSTDKIGYICSDVRFVNEYNYLKSHGFFMIRITREASTKINDVSELEQDQIPNDGFDYVIENNGSMLALEEEVKKIARGLK